MGYFRDVRNNRNFRAVRSVRNIRNVGNAQMLKILPFLDSHNLKALTRGTIVRVLLQAQPTWHNCESPKFYPTLTDAFSFLSEPILAD